MAITFVGAGTYTTSTSSISVPMPSAYQEGDLLVLMTVGRSATPALPSGWTNIGTHNNNYSSAWAYLRVSYKVATSSESNVTVADSGYQTSGIVIAFRGVDTTIPIHQTALGRDSNTTYAAPDITTTIDNAMILYAIGFNESTSSTDTTNYSSWASPSLESITEASDNIVTNTYGTGIASAYGIMTTAGTVAGATATADYSGNYSGTIAIALKPAIVQNFITGYWMMNGIAKAM